ncbi:unnamed protein product [Acanthoscelides obtectus]|uniref:Adenosine kinase n=1 Tax=Acanthoscelides obtectus TaxID=200917 RepID=A0A9P0JLE1_ACAOB|nr:unnamed protein product [Acanthoscelides obtectus]CAK1672886.1 Adenosine kinase [Acanthoscelides obtectus]
MKNFLPPFLRFEKFRSPGGCSQNTLRVLQWVLNKQCEAIIFGSVGKDEESEELKILMNKSGVQTRYVQQNLPTGKTLALVKNKISTLVACVGAAEYLPLSDLLSLEDINSIMERASYVYIEGFFLTKRAETANYILNLSMKHGKPVLFNLSGKYIIDIHPVIIQHFAKSSNYLFGTLEEFEALWKSMGLQTMQAFINSIMKHRNEKSVVITNGGNPGYFVENSSEIKRFEVLKIKDDDIRDTTGTGDAFVGGFIAALICKKTSITECIKTGTYAACQILQQTGCTLPNFECNALK